MMRSESHGAADNREHMSKAKLFTKAELRLRREAEKIAELGKVNFWDAEEWEKGLERKTLLQICIHNMVVSTVVSQYTLFDEVLADLICRYYFKRSGTRRFLLWRQKQFRTFVHFILDEMYLLKKMQLVHAIKPLPPEIRGTIKKVNAIRNSMAHTLFPQNRKNHRKA